MQKPFTLHSHLFILVCIYANWDLRILQFGLPKSEVEPRFFCAEFAWKNADTRPDDSLPLLTTRVVLTVLWFTFRLFSDPIIVMVNELEISAFEWVLLYVFQLELSSSSPPSPSRISCVWLHIRFNDPLMNPSAIQRRSSCKPLFRFLKIDDYKQN